MNRMYIQRFMEEIMDAKLIELTICAQKGDMEAFSNLIISFFTALDILFLIVLSGSFRILLISFVVKFSE